MSFGYGTVWRFLARHGITRKKTTAHAAEQEREDVAAAREAWFESQLDLDPTKLVFLDGDQRLDEHGAALRLVRARRALSRRRAARALEDDDADRRSALRRHRRGQDVRRRARRPGFPGLPPERVGSDPRRRRHRGDGQRPHPQGQRRARDPRGVRSEGPLPSGLFAGLQSDREMLRQDQGVPAQSRRSLPRRAPRRSP